MRNFFSIPLNILRFSIGEKRILSSFERIVILKLSGDERLKKKRLIYPFEEDNLIK